MGRPRLDFLTKNIQPGKIIVARGSGAVFTDQTGKKYLDFSAQTLNLNLGFNHPKIIKAITVALKNPLFISSRFGSESLNKLGGRLVSIAPYGLSKVNLKLTNGSDANESAFKRARKFHQRPLIISFHKSHLGESGETLAASGGPQQGFYLGGSKNFLFVNPPFRRFYPRGIRDYESRSLSEIERILKSHKDVAGLILEPIMVNAGILIFPKHYLEKLRQICSRNHIALIFDEIQTAFGWLGKIFAAEYYGITPDLLTFGKGLTAGLPLAGVLMKKEYDVLEYGEDEYTYGGYPLSCAAALANLDVLLTTNILHTISQKSARLGAGLIELQKVYSQIVDVRGVGLLWGVEFNRSKASAELPVDKVYQKCLQAGLVLRRTENNYGNALVLKPPINVTFGQIDRAVNILEASIKKAFSLFG